MKIKPCLYYSCCGVTLLIGVTLVVIELFFIEGLIRSQAQQGIVMTNQTYGLWGIIPGDTQTYTVRNFTIFNFTNAQKFLYTGAVTPQFVEIGDFLYQEKSQFINYEFNDDQSQVHYDYWLYFDLLKESRNVEQKYTVINVAPLGFWMQLDTAPVTSFTLQGFGGLFLEMNNTIKTQAIGQGVSETFLQTYDVFSLICSNLGISDKFCWYLWNDRYYGLDNEVNLQFWVKAAYFKDSQTKQCLYEHFYPIPAFQFEGLLQQIYQLSEGVDHILSNWFCPDNEQTCTSYKFTIKQLSSAGITNNPPPGSEPQESICSTNSTCIGSPEIITFVRHEFKQKYPDQKYQKLTFSQQTFKALFTPYEGLLNIGTLNKIYEIGNLYDDSHEKDLLTQLKQIFHAETEDHALVIWEWIKYMTNQFVLKLGNGGSRKIAGLGGVFSQAWYQVTYTFADWFLKDAYSFLTFKQIGKDCGKTLNFLPQQTSKKICQSNVPDPTDYKLFYNLIQPCLNLTHFFLFRDQYNISNIDMQSYCDIDEDPSNIGLITIKIMETVANKYSCNESFPTKKCIELDIIIRQVFNSTITLNPLDIQGYPYKDAKDISAHAWNIEIPVFQYQYFLKISDISDPQTHLESDVRDIFTFDKLLNGPDVQELFLIQNVDEFYHKYHWEIPSLLRNYIRFVIIQVGFGGFTQQRSPKELFFGYQDEFLKNLQETDTMEGGDPSIQYLIAFNQLNMTQQQARINDQAMYTGKNDTKITRIYQSLYNKTFIAVNDTYFDGKEVQWNMVTPWAEQVPLQGSDGFSVPPNLDQSDKPTVYISSIARFAKTAFKQTLRKFDMQLRDMRIDRSALASISENPQNAKYYQTLSCFLNSSYQGFPLFVSKNHFLDADPKWAKLVKIVDQKGHIMQANDWDDTRLYIEPYTGTAFSATIYLQSNYYFRADDILFPSYQKVLASRKKNATIQQTDEVQLQRMLPIVNTWRSGNISSEAVDKYFGDLRTITNNKRKIALVGWLLISLCFIVVIGLKVKKILDKKKGPRQEEKKGSLLQSSQAVQI